VKKLEGELFFSILEFFINEWLKNLSIEKDSQKEENQLWEWVMEFKEASEKLQKRILN
jgi:hypothetical protein